MTVPVLPTTMRVPLFTGNGAIAFANKPVPRPDPGQLLVQVRANALCGSERGQFYGGSAVTPGHEAAGVVVAAGAETHTAVGTPGVVYLMDYCGVCRSCRSGATNQCRQKRADMGFSHDGGYGPYLCIAETIFFPLSADLPVTDGPLLLDIMGTGGHALDRARLVHTDITSVLIAGAGPIGLGVLAMAKLLLGERLPVVIADVIPYRLALAEALGGIPIDLRETNMPEGVHAHLPRGADVAIDTSGKGIARQAAMESLDQRGVLICVGHGEGLQLDVSRDLIGPERAVLGSEYFRFDEFPANLRLLRQHHAYLARIITHRFPLSELQQAFTLFFQGETGKVFIEQE